jgi:hypothetical protein
VHQAVCLSVAIAFLAGVSQINAAEPPAAPSAEEKGSRSTTNADRQVQDSVQCLRYARIVRDLAAFDLSTLSTPQTGAWIVARIHPGERSGAAYVQGLYIEAETGRVIDRGIRPVVVNRVHGKWELIDVMSGHAPRGGTYQWTRPQRHNHFDRNFSLLDSFSAFEAGPTNRWTVICQFLEKNTGAAQFASVTMIPDEWETFVKPAREYYVQHAADFGDKDLNTLREMALSDNPLIGLTAIRRILDKKAANEDTDAFVDLVRSLPKYRQAVFIVGLLNSNDDDSRDIVSKAVGQAKNASELSGMALGLYCSLALRPHTEPEREMLDKLTERWKSLDPLTADENSLSRLVLAPGVQQGKPTSRKE